MLLLITFLYLFYPKFIGHKAQTETSEKHTEQAAEKGTCEDGANKIQARNTEHRTPF